MSSFYSRKELASLGLASYGEDVLISNKASIYKPEMISLGNKVRIEDFSIITGPLKIGSYVHIAAGAYLRPCDDFPIIFEDATGIAPRVTIFTSTDDYNGPFLFGPHFPVEMKNPKKGIVRLEQFTLVGSQTIILPNVTLREGTAIGAMSLIARTTKPWTVYFGIPAHAISKRDKKIKNKFDIFTSGA